MKITILRISTFSLIYKTSYCPFKTPKKNFARYFCSSRYFFYPFFPSVSLFSPAPLFHNYFFNSSKSKYFKISLCDTKCFSTGIRTRDSVNTSPAIDRQVGVMLENLPKEKCNETQVINIFENKRITIDKDDILVMRSRLGVPTGRVLVLSEEKIGDEILESLPFGCTYRIVDEYETALFVEQCERFVYLSEDLHRLADSKNLENIVTISDIPRTYGRLQLKEVINHHCNILIDPRNIVFRFSKNGIQSDMAWIICDKKEIANLIISKIKETAIPKRFEYGELFGCAFIWSSRSSLFLSDSSLDFLLNYSKFQVYTGGWFGDVSLTEFQCLLSRLKIYPKSIKRMYLSENKSSSFFLVFDRFKDAKIIIQRLHLLKKRWRIPTNEIFYAFPKMADLNWDNEEKHADEDSANDSDIDEEIDY